MARPKISGRIRLRSHSDGRSQGNMEERLAKQGPELFKELKRIYSVAEVEDYFKNGVWREDLMRTDLQLIEVHRREVFL